MTIRVKLLPHQYDYVTAQAKHPCLLGGFGCGKTRGFIAKAVDQLQRPENRGKTGLLAEPTFPMVRDILLHDLIDTLRDFDIPCRLHKSELRIETRLGNILLRSAENWERWRGLNLAWGGIDEVAQLRDRQAWDMLLSRLRNAGTLTGFAASTPEGFNFVYDLWGSVRDGYHLIRGKTTDNWHLPQEYINSLYSNYSPRLIEQYVHGEFVVLEGRVFEEYSEENHDEWQYRPGLETAFAMDFGYNRPSILCLQHDHHGNDHLYSEIRCRNESTHAQAAKMAALRDKENWNPGRRTRVYCDPAGAGHQSSSHLTDVAILQQHGFEPVYTTSRHLRAVNAGIEYTQSRFCNGAGERRLYVNPKCAPDAHRSLQGYRYKEGNKSEPDKDGINDHDPDALRYYVMNRYAPALARGRNIG